MRDLRSGAARGQPTTPRISFRNWNSKPTSFGLPSWLLSMPERVADVRIEVEVVRPGARLLAGIDVHDEDDVVLVARLVAAEHEEVRDVRSRIEGDRAAPRGGSRPGGSRPRPARRARARARRAARPRARRGREQLSPHGASSCLLSVDAPYSPRRRSVRSEPRPRRSRTTVRYGSRVRGTRRTPPK